MKILPVGAELFHSDRRTDRHDEANSRFKKFLETRLKRLRFRVETREGQQNQEDMDPS